MSAFGIVWFHALSPGWTLAYSGLTVFLILSAYFAALDRGSGPVSRTLGRLLIPWAVWSALFAILDVGRGKAVLDTANGPVAGILGGAAPHLWYIPFLFAVILSLAGVRATPLWRFRSTLAALGVAAILLLWPPYRTWMIAAGSPVSQYAHALLPTFVGISLAGAKWRSAQFTAIVCICAALAAAFLLRTHETALLSYAIGSALCGLALVLTHVRPWSNGTADRGGELTLGIYLMHPLPLAALRAAWPSDPAHPAIPVLAFLMSLTAAAMLRRWGGRIGCRLIGLKPARLTAGAGSPV